MKYRDFIQKRFLIDEPKTGKLVPFVFRDVQNKYYDELVEKYDIEKLGISAPVREIILKARRQGFSSLILALFAADDILNDNPTESLAISYKDDATATFRRRYRVFVLSYGAIQAGYSVAQIQANVNILEEVAKVFLAVDSTDIVLAHNKAHFYCGTASARTGGRGGVLQKVLFSEEAHYPDSEKMTASEIVDGTLRQVDIASGWVFRESTANGYGNYYERTWALAVKLMSRFRPRFFSWEEFYTEKEFEQISSEFTDKQILKQEYPRTPEEAFIASGSGFFDNELIQSLLTLAPAPKFIGSIFLDKDTKVPEFAPEESAETAPLWIWKKPEPYHSYTMGGDVAEGLPDGDYSVLQVIDNKSLEVVARWKSRLSPPDEFALAAYALGIWYNQAYTGIEVNKDGLWVNSELFKMGYPNLYFREQMDDITHAVGRKVGFKTDERTRPYILSELRKMLALEKGIWKNEGFLVECLTFVRNKMGRPEAMSGKNDDEIMATAIAFEIRRNTPKEYQQPQDVPQTKENYVKARLEKLYKKKSNPLSQTHYIK